LAPRYGFSLKMPNIAYGWFKTFNKFSIPWRKKYFSFPIQLKTS